MRYISESLSASPLLHLHTKFIKKPIRNIGDMTKIITSRIWSPITWRGSRRSENFQSSDYCALDFDDSLPIYEAMDIFKDYKCIIATTQNHQKEKHGLVADRFRVIIPWERRIDDANEYIFNMQSLIKEYGADAACKDAGRLFKPSLAVVWTNDNEPLPVLRYSPPPVVSRPPIKNPGWLEDMILRGTEMEPGRNVAAFKIAAASFRCGNGAGETYHMLTRAFGVNTLSENELRKIIKNAEKKTALNQPGINAAKLQ
jgi:hypothetical protein